MCVSVSLPGAFCAVCGCVGVCYLCRAVDGVGFFDVVHSVRGVCVYVFVGSDSTDRLSGSSPGQSS